MHDAVGFLSGMSYCDMHDWRVLNAAKNLSMNKQMPIGTLSRVTVAAVKAFCCGQYDNQDWKTPHRSKVLTIHICEDIAWVDRVDSDTILSMQHGKVPGDLQTSTSSHINTLSLTTRCARQLALAMLTWEDTQQAVIPAAGRTLQI